MPIPLTSTWFRWILCLRFRNTQYSYKLIRLWLHKPLLPRDTLHTHPPSPFLLCPANPQLKERKPVPPCPIPCLHALKPPLPEPFQPLRPRQPIAVVRYMVQTLAAAIRVEELLEDIRWRPSFPFRPSSLGVDEGFKGKGSMISHTAWLLGTMAKQTFSWNGAGRPR
jgi:hypothetical protein